MGFREEQDPQAGQAPPNRSAVRGLTCIATPGSHAEAECGWEKRRECPRRGDLLRPWGFASRSWGGGRASRMVGAQYLISRTMRGAGAFVLPGQRKRDARWGPRRRLPKSTISGGTHQPWIRRSIPTFGWQPGGPMRPVLPLGADVGRADLTCGRVDIIRCPRRTGEMYRRRKRTAMTVAEFSGQWRSGPASFFKRGWARCPRMGRYVG